MVKVIPLHILYNSDYDDFLVHQKASVVEVYASRDDISSIKSIVSLGGGLIGTVVDAEI